MGRRWSRWRSACPPGLTAMPCHAIAFCSMGTQGIEGNDHKTPQHAEHANQLLQERCCRNTGTPGECRAVVRCLRSHLGGQLYRCIQQLQCARRKPGSVGSASHQQDSETMTDVYDFDGNDAGGATDLRIIGKSLQQSGLAKDSLIKLLKV